MIFRILLALFSGCAVSLFAADPVVDKAVQDAQKKYPAGDYGTKGEREVRSRSVTSSSFEIHAVAPELDGTRKWFSYEHDGAVEKLALETEVLLDQQSIKAAWVEHDSEGAPMVRLIFTGAGAQKFGELTQKLINKRIGLVFEGRLVSAPMIRNAIYGGEAILHVGSESEAVEMAAKLNPPPSK
jgi:preprotein translocase subunit SecD